MVMTEHIYIYKESGTIYHMIFIYGAHVYIYSTHLSPGFLHFFQILISNLQKMAQSDKKLCLLNSIS